MTHETPKPNSEDLKRLTRQLKLEDEHQSAGYKKAVKNDHRNKERNYGSHTSIGKVIRRELVGNLGLVLKTDYAEIATGKATKCGADIYRVFADQQINWDRVSHIGLATLLDYCFFSDDSVSKIELRIGQRIQDDLKLRYYKKVDPDTFANCEKWYIRNTAGYSQKVYSTSKVIKAALKEQGRDEEQWSNWGDLTSRAIGSWIVAHAHATFAHLTGLNFLKTHQVPGKGKSIDHTYRLHDDIRDVELNNQIQAGMSANYKDNPMVCPPNDWSLETCGGFLTNRVTQRYPLIRREGTTIPSPVAIGSLNKLQQTAWKINPFVLEQLLYFYERGESINPDDPFKPFLYPEEHDIPKIDRDLVDLPPIESASTDERREELTELHAQRDAQSKEINKWWNRLADRRKNARIHQLVSECAKTFAKEERFWIPWSFDFRTRMYPISILNPQSANHINGLMMFADGYTFRDESGRITDTSVEYSLAVHVATTKGYSKETFDGRVEWVHANRSEIEAVATDPLGRGRTFWTDEADEPWTYLAACREYYECFISKTKDFTQVPCGLDATASGLQILGSLMGDESTCRYVNVLPTDKPSDLYQVIIDKTINLIKTARPRRRGIPLDQLTRKVAKAPTMTLAYGSTPWRRKSQVRDSVNGPRGLNLNLKWEKIDYLAKKLDEAISFVLPGATFLLNWLQSVAVESMDQRINPGKTMVTWTTPSGCLVHQRYFKSELLRVKTIALGMSKYRRPREYVDGDQPDLSKIEASTAANFVHSLDASILQLAVKDLDFPFSLTHDCFYARAGTDLKRMTVDVKQAFIEVVSSDVLQEFAHSNGLPMYCDYLHERLNTNFNYDEIRRSNFLFC
jgi:DNA-directed RNA polymerase